MIQSRLRSMTPRIHTELFIKIISFYTGIIKVALKPEDNKIPSYLQEHPTQRKAELTDEEKPTADGITDHLDGYALTFS